ncbi:hypothetical protein FIBSPDRAFT_103349 [Athelia psychrophila]|uniref:Uncharacterized protein n=1 Tax=Athelia psychrophila TaxID=1759441 RepID=A0A166DG62_9AGAM|nr:hypothetical protein FIBSPDRAFT_103349 [Fibularhizoctonia sp. CBS 109695]
MRSEDTAKHQLLGRLFPADMSLPSLIGNSNIRRRVLPVSLSLSTCSLTSTLHDHLEFAAYCDECIAEGNQRETNSNTGQTSDNIGSNIRVPKRASHCAGGMYDITDIDSSPLASSLCFPLIGGLVGTCYCFADHFPAPRVSHDLGRYRLNSPSSPAKWSIFPQ